MQKLWIWTSKSMPDLWFSAVFWIVLRVLEDLLELKRPLQGYLIINFVIIQNLILPCKTGRYAVWHFLRGHFAFVEVTNTAWFI